LTVENNACQILASQAVTQSQSSLQQLEENRKQIQEKMSQLNQYYEDSSYTQMYEQIKLIEAEIRMKSLS
jgi:F0F1-type ATP synthase epsilon subunit